MFLLRITIYLPDWFDRENHAYRDIFCKYFNPAEKPFYRNSLEPAKKAIGGVLKDFGSLKNYSWNWPWALRIKVWAMYQIYAVDSLNAAYRRLNCQRSVFLSGAALLKAFFFRLERQLKNGLYPRVTLDRFTQNRASCMRTVCRDKVSNEQRRTNLFHYYWHVPFKLIYINGGIGSHSGASSIINLS